ncbi:hypothetical protein N7478_010305 [Penicillium angulare]|uniref:uncharacterized protein n=1 Tax=Penicillium angulare TaxID=116970 RepID=UPI00253FA6D2|nr:uncharacterized protein N7478_010305 [Penicillium angulare]KAJ5267497.1 hypothetical protein N7478_010305 [Penicillium angulare]
MLTKNIFSNAFCLLHYAQLTISHEHKAQHPPGVRPPINWTLTDTHIHAIPPVLAQAIAEHGGDPSGEATPDWSLEGTLESLDSIGSAHGILSISTPGVPIAGTGQEARDLCRQINNYLADLAMNSTRLDFFAALPDWRDIAGTLAEIDWIYTEQKSAVGVIFYTSYGDYLPGDASFSPIWERLEQYKALTFMHPGTMNVSPFLINGKIPQPIVDYPQQTTRAAVDLVLGGTRSQTPNVDMILSHAGGTFPFIAERVLGSLALQNGFSNISALKATAEFARFYYDIALSGTATQLDALLVQTSPDHILLGSDYPYTPPEGIIANQASYMAWAAAHPQLSPATLTANAKAEIESHRIS